MTMTIEPIGTIQTPFKDLEGMPIQPSGAKDVQGVIVIDPKYEQGLDDLDGFSHIILLYQFHHSKGYHLKVTPFLDNTKRGLFSTRAPPPSQSHWPVYCQADKKRSKSAGDQRY